MSDTRRALLKQAGERLAQYGIETAVLDARLLFQAASGLRHEDIVAEPDLNVPPEAAARYSLFIERRCRWVYERVPVSSRGSDSVLDQRHQRHARRLAPAVAAQVKRESGYEASRLNPSSLASYCRRQLRIRFASRGDIVA